MNDILKRPKIFKWQATPAKYYLKEQDIHLDIELDELIITAMLLDRAIMQERQNMTKSYKRSKQVTGDPLFNCSGTFEQYLDIHLQSPLKLKYKIIDDHVEAYLYATSKTHLTHDTEIVHFMMGHISNFYKLYVQSPIFLLVNKEVYQKEYSNLKLLDPLFTGMEEALILLDNEYINKSILWIESSVKSYRLDKDRIKLHIKDPTTHFGNSVKSESKYKNKD